jgi:predicted 2-oxoglutarate/Fe(II)-dependent dioxygenase YbiX
MRGALARRAKARRLIALSQPARFGRGEETLTDLQVRDTWEIPRHLVRAEWDDAGLKDVLATVKEELGLPNAAGLTADLHSLLVYEPGQFFLPHQDSEKSDDMVATLVVTLPSSYAGGEVMVEHNGEKKAYRGSKTALSLVAFYADCWHEVLKVTSDYRITLTYNLLLHGDTSRPAGDEGTAAELASLLREHFSTPTTRYHDGPPAAPPSRLVYLLDHEYTPRALAWSRRKGDDAARVSLLRAAADWAGCEAILALTDVKETHDAYPADEVYRYQRRHWYGDYDEYVDQEDGEDEDGREYVIQGLVDSEITLTHWAGPDSARLEETSLYVRDAEVCASTPSGELVPYSQELPGVRGLHGELGQHAGPLVPPRRGRRVAQGAGVREPRRNVPCVGARRARRVVGIGRPARRTCRCRDARAVLGRHAPKPAGTAERRLRQAAPQSLGRRRLRGGRGDRGNAAAPIPGRQPHFRARQTAHEDRRHLRPAMDGGPAAGLVRRRSACVGIQRRTGPAPVGNRPTARPVQAPARHWKRWHDGRAAAA